MSSRDSLEDLLLEIYATHRCGSFEEGFASFDFKTAMRLLKKHEGSVRLEEAKWNRAYWHEHNCIDGISQGHGGDIETCGFCVELTQRIADLKRAAAPKPSEAANEDR